MDKRYYILHEDLDVPENGIAYFGPFDEAEIDDVANDVYADCLAGSGDVDVVELTDEEAAKVYINPREYWMEQVRSIEQWTHDVERGTCRVCGETRSSAQSNACQGGLAHDWL